MLDTDHFVSTLGLKQMRTQKNKENEEGEKQNLRIRPNKKEKKKDIDSVWAQLCLTLARPWTPCTCHRHGKHMEE